jgi:hypothetical protein
VAGKPKTLKKIDFGKHKQVEPVSSKEGTLTTIITLVVCYYTSFLAKIVEVKNKLKTLYSKEPRAIADTEAEDHFEVSMSELVPTFTLGECCE